MFGIVLAVISFSRAKSGENLEQSRQRVAHKDVSAMNHSPPVLLPVLSLCKGSKCIGLIQGHFFPD